MTYTQVREIEGDDTCTFGCATGSRALFSVMDGEGRRYGSRTAELGQGREWIDVPASAEVTTRLVVEDGEGEPLPDVVVALRPLGGAPHQTLTEVTDEDGAIPGGHFGEVDLQVAVGHSQGRLAPWRVVEVGEGDPLRLILKGSASLVVRLKGNDGPVAGVSARIGVPGHSLSFLRTSNAEGLTLFDLLEPDEYELEIHGDGWWPVRQTASASANPALLEIPMRRRGGLTIRVRRDGLPVQGAQLELKSLEEGDDLSAWIKSGEVQLGDTGLTTDVKGEVRLLGAPEGTYRWSLPEAGDSVWGAVELVGGEVGEVEVAHP